MVMTLPLTTSRRRCVSFAAPECSVRVDETIPALQDMSEDDKRARYWTPSEFHHIKLNARLDTRHERKTELKGIRQLEDMLHTAHRIAMTIDDLNDFDAMEYARDLDIWTTAGQGRGLEKYVSQRQRQERSDASRISIRCVVQECRLLHKDVHAVAAAYATYTRVSAIYASIVGAADALAVYGDAVSSASTTSSMPEDAASASESDFSGIAPAIANGTNLLHNDETPLPLHHSSGRRGLLSRSKSPTTSTRKRVLLTSVVC